MKKGKTICIDFDGVIASYQDGWEGTDKFGTMVPGTDNALKVLKEEGYTIIIFTCRKVTEALKKYLKENNITYDYINENPNEPEGTNKGKPIADIYVDDRAVCFRGNWKWTLQDIAYFEPWEKNDKEEKKDMQKVFDDYRKYSKEYRTKCDSPN